MGMTNREAALPLREGGGNLHSPITWFRRRDAHLPAETVERMIPRLRRYAWIILGDLERADDAVEACLKIALVDVRNRSVGNIRTYLFHVLQASIERTQNGQGSSVVCEKNEGDERNAPNRRYAQAAIKDAFDTLPAEHKTALALVVIERFSYEETAEVLVTSSDDVRSRVAEGRQIIETFLHGDNAEGPRIPAMQDVR